MPVPNLQRLPQHQSTEITEVGMKRKRAKFPLELAASRLPAGHLAMLTTIKWHPPLHAELLGATY